MKFTKMHGLGNDYIYIEDNNNDIDYSKLSIILSDRHKGIGADGIITISKSNKADLVSLTHLIKYLTILKEILGGMVLDKTLLAQKIAEAFSSTNDLTDPINRNIEAVAEELINSFNLNKN